MQDLVLRIYDTVADATLWPEVLQRFADGIDARGCIVFEWDRTPGARALRASHASSFYDPAAIATYVAKCFDHEARDQDLFEAHSLARDGIDLVEDDILAPTLADLRALPNVQVLQKLGILHRAAGLLNKDNTQVSRFSVQLAEGRGRLTEAERATMAQVLPHIAKALDLGRPAERLAAEQIGLLAAMDRLTVGVCLLDRQGRPVATNTEFRRQQDAFPGVFLMDGGPLRLSDPTHQRMLEHLRQDARHHGKFGARPRKEAISPDGQTFLCLELAPLARSTEIGSDRFDGAVLYSTDTSLPLHCDTRPLQRAFDLTDAECALVNLIADGLTNGQIADQRDRSVATINAQVKSILGKTGCATRTQFVRLLMGFGADHRRRPT